MAQFGYTSVQESLLPGVAGQAAGPFEPANSIRSYVIASGGDTIAPGYGVVLTGDSVALPSGGSDKFAGVAFADGSLPIEDAGYGPADENLRPEIPVAGHAIRVWVVTTQATTPESPVYLQHTSHSGNLPGTFRADSDSSNALLVTGCRWDLSLDAGLGCLLLNLPA